MRQQSLNPHNAQWAMNSLQNRKAQSVGLYGEVLLKNILEDNGYSVVTPRAGEQRGDLRAIDPDSGEIITIEVKTARRNSVGNWQFTLWKKGKTSHRHSDVVVLLAVTKVGLPAAFVIPVADIRDVKAISISSHPLNYAGKYAQYRQSLHQLDLAVLS